MSKIVFVGANHAGTAAINTVLDNYSNNEVVVFDRNSNISFLGCGMALWIGNVIDGPEGLFYSSKEKMEAKGATVHMESEISDIDFENKIKIKNTIREQYGVTQNDFLIVTGGKIDQKKNIDLLIDACGNQNNVKLLIFGSIIDEMKTDFSKKINKYSNIIYVGWVNSEKVYDYFFSADLVFFPGQHSVLWEQACASKVPCVFKRWKGMTHVNNGGNADFLNDISIQSITDKIQELRFTDKYFHMKEIANSSATDVYLYSNIARKSLECVEWNEKKYFE